MRKEVPLVAVGGETGGAGGEGISLKLTGGGPA